MITPLPESELMHREIGGSRLAVIEDAGHVSNLEQPGKLQSRANQIPARA